MRTMFLDIETYSPADLAECGVYRYASDPDFEVLLIAYAIADSAINEDPDVRVFEASTAGGKNLPGGLEADEFRQALLDPEVVKIAFNANFERTCLSVWYDCALGLPPEHWRCAMVKSLSCGLPGSLAAVGEALGLPADKQKDAQGKALIKYFCKPCRPTKANGGRTRNLPAHDPGKWELFKSYCRQDVVTEIEIWKQLARYKTPESEQRLWCLDQDINDFGIGIDRDMVEAIVEYDEERKEQLLAEATDLTGLSNPNSLAQLKPWMASEGVPVDSLRKDDISALMGSDLPEHVRRVLQIRQALGKTSTAKYSAMLSALCPDGRVHGLLQFYGASRTGRWAGRLVQVQNLARNSLPDLDLARQLVKEKDFDTLETLFGEPAFVFSELVRTAFVPSEGSRFIVSDFSAIEARVVAWLAGEDWALQAFKDGKDIYCETASRMYHKPVVKHGENGELRQKGKIAVLACGYGGGVGAMKAMDPSGSIPEDKLQSVVDQWRQANPAICKLWRDYETAARTAIQERRVVKRGIRIPAENLQDREYMAGGPVRPYSVRDCNGVTFSYLSGNLFVQLPSGRSICYWQARVKDGAKGPQIVYKGVNQTTRQWTDTETWGGKIVENVVQAVARDCLAEAMLRVNRMGYPIVMHVHDELIADVPENDWTAVPRITEAMGTGIPWAPGLPLKGETYECAYYCKD